MSLLDLFRLRPRYASKLRGLTVRAAERRLRDLGMSARQAKRYIAEHRPNLGLVRHPEQ